MNTTGNSTRDAEQQDWKISCLVLEGRFDRLMRLEPPESVVQKLWIDDRRASADADDDGGTVQQLRKLLERMAADGNPAADQWPSDEAALKAAATYYRRASLFLEVQIERPLLDPDVPLEAPVEKKLLPVVDAVKAILPDALQTLLPDEPAVKALLDKGPWSEKPDVAQRWRRTELGPHRTLFKHVAVYYILLQAKKYKIFRITPTILAGIATRLKEISEMIDRVLPSARGGSESMLGLRGLLALQRGRIARAQGGRFLADAEAWLTDAVGFYEERAAVASRAAKVDSAARPQGGKDGRHYLISGSYRVAAALLQLSYLNHLVGQQQLALRQLKAARLLALHTENEILESEIELVALSVRCALLKPGPPPRGDRWQHAELRQIERGLKRLLQLNRAYGRKEYFLMAIYDLTLCDMHAGLSGSEKEVKSAVDRAGDMYLLANGNADEGDKSRRVAPADEDVYWTVSALVLTVQLQVRFARAAAEREAAEREAAERDARRVEVARQAKEAHLASAFQAGKHALALLRRFGGRENLRVQCRAYLAEALILAGEDPDKHLKTAIPSTSPAGFTTNPFVSATTMLLRAEWALHTRQPDQARTLLARVRREALPRVENRELHDQYARVRRLAERMHYQWLPTDEELAEDQAKGEGDREYTYKKLRARLRKYLIDTTTRIDDKAKRNDAHLARMIGITTNTLRTWKPGNNPSSEDETPTGDPEASPR